MIPLDQSQEMFLEILPPIFECNYDILNNQNVAKRVYPTRCNKNVSDDKIKVINFSASNTVKKNWYTIPFQH